MFTFPTTYFKPLTSAWNTDQLLVAGTTTRPTQNYLTLTALTSTKFISQYLFSSDIDYRGLVITRANTETTDVSVDTTSDWLGGKTAGATIQQYGIATCRVDDNSFILATTVSDQGVTITVRYFNATTTPYTQIGSRTYSTGTLPSEKASNMINCVAVSPTKVVVPWTGVSSTMGCLLYTIVAGTNINFNSFNTTSLTANIDPALQVRVYVLRMDDNHFHLTFASGTYIRNTVGTVAGTAITYAGSADVSTGSQTIYTADIISATSSIGASITSTNFIQILKYALSSTIVVATGILITTIAQSSATPTQMSHIAYLGDNRAVLLHGITGQTHIYISIFGTGTATPTLISGPTILINSTAFIGCKLKVTSGTCITVFTTTRFAFTFTANTGQPYIRFCEV